MVQNQGGLIMEIISKSSMGELIISDEVLSSIAVNAAKDVDGVSSFCNKPVDVVNTIKVIEQNDKPGYVVEQSSI